MMKTEYVDLSRIADLTVAARRQHVTTWDKNPCALLEKVRVAVLDPTSPGSDDGESSSCLQVNLNFLRPHIDMIGLVISNNQYVLSLTSV